MQTKRGGPDVPPEERGDCLDACLASILEVPIAETPVPHVGDWWEHAQVAVERHGYRLVYLCDKRSPTVQIAAWLGPVYWLAGVPSLNLPPPSEGHPVLHMIVMRGGEIVHDPSLGDRYPLGPAADLEIHDAMLLVPLHPRSSSLPVDGREGR